MSACSWQVSKSGGVIGRRGETLDAIQYLASLVANRGEGEYIRLSIDSGNYREKRARTLEALPASWPTRLCAPAAASRWSR